MHWEYREFVYQWAPKKRPYVRITPMLDQHKALTQPEQLLTLWNKSQAEILLELQRWHDQGWTAITEVGPAAIQTRRTLSYARGLRSYRIFVLFLFMALLVALALLLVGMFALTALISLIMLVPFCLIFSLAGIGIYAEATEVRVHMRRG